MKKFIDFTVNLEDKSKDQGRFFWKKRWISFCSRHKKYQRYCDICNSGRWENVWVMWFSGKVYDYFPKFWIWWVNFPKYIINFKKIKDLHENF
jgi:hypothetical protein